MSVPYSVRVYAQITIAVAGLLLLPALWSLCSAVWSAFTTGQVLVISIGRYESAREMVSWYQGWPRFVGPLILVFSLFLWGSADKNSKEWWVASSLAACGIILLSFSIWFISWHRVFWFFGIISFSALALFIDNRYGRLPALVFVVIVVFTVCWMAIRNS